MVTPKSPMNLFDAMGEQPFISVTELFSRLEIALKQSFGSSIWIKGEISNNVTEKGGHCYFQLSDHDSTSDNSPNVNCVIWSSSYSRIKKQLILSKLSIAKGTVIKVNGTVKYYPRRSEIQFQIIDLDVAGLIGDMALARLKLMGQLGKEGLLNKNKQIPIPLVPLKVALVGSPGTQGFLDFMTQINASKFNFKIREYPVPVQGPETPPKISAVLSREDINENDIVVIVRGGGSQNDLAAFNTEIMARSAANCSIPVFTGIGHTEDMSVVDEVASRSFITPTECGQQIVNMVQRFYDDLHEKFNMIFTFVNFQITDNTAKLEKFTDRINIEGTKIVDSSNTSVELRRHKLQDGGRGVIVDAESKMMVLRNYLIGSSIGVTVEANRELRARSGVLSLHANNLIESNNRELSNSINSLLVGQNATFKSKMQMLDSKRSNLLAYDPKAILKRGYAVVRSEAKHVVKSVTGLDRGNTIYTEFDDGIVSSKITEIDMF